MKKQELSLLCKNVPAIEDLSFYKGLSASVNLTASCQIQLLALVVVYLFPRSKRNFILFLEQYKTLGA
jgi:hypothetical protein